MVLEDVQMSKKKAKTVPKLTRDEVESKIARVAALQAQAVKFKATASKGIAAIAEKCAGHLAPIDAEVGAIVDEIFDWAEANRGDICAEGTKTATFATGEINWRLDPPSVSLPKKPEKVDALIERLRDAKLSFLIRHKAEISKEAVLGVMQRREPWITSDAIVQRIADEFPEIKIKQDETINLKPNQVAIEPVELSRKMK
jgi:phage host-nuclease inhibitor protein Gam